MPKNKNIVLYIGPYNELCFKAVKDLEKHLGKKLRVAFLVTKKSKKIQAYEKKSAFVIRVDHKNLADVEKKIAEVKDRILVVSCRSEFYLPLYANIISLFPSLNMPTKDSVMWSLNKLAMRKKFRRYYPEITPSFVQVHGATKEDLELVKSKVGFPCVVKPASLAASRLVSICYHKEELQSTLRKVFRTIKSAYKNAESHVEPEVIVEQFMEGDMYSIDSYVDDTGHIKDLPSVHVKTGQNIGVDDFYNYRVLTPTRLKAESERAVQEVGHKAVESLGLRSCMVHMEFIRDDNHWKVLEITPRMGGHRDLMYREAYGVPHGMNDLLIRMSEKPVVKKRVKKYVASFNIFPKKTGKIKKIKGLKKVKELESLLEFIQVKKVGDRAGLSKNGFKKVLDITLANKSREDLFADIRRLEKAVEIVV